MWLSASHDPTIGTASRRSVLIASGLALSPLAGCLSAPSSGGPPFSTVEVDDGPVYGPGLQDDLDMDFFAGLITSADGARHFDLDEETHPEAVEFLATTDFTTSLLGVVQISGINSSMHVDVVDLALTPVNLTAVLALRDDPPHSEDRVITTILIKVPRRGNAPPEQIWVELSIGERHETFSGGPPTAGESA